MTVDILFNFCEFIKGKFVSFFFIFFKFYIIFLLIDHCFELLNLSVHVFDPYSLVFCLVLSFFFRALYVLKIINSGCHIYFSQFILNFITFFFNFI